MFERAIAGTMVIGAALAVTAANARLQPPAKLVSPPPLLELARFLPAAADLQGWSPKDSPQVFKGDELFLYIDGGAEIYHEYGFRQVLAQDYENREKRRMTMEIFEMANAACAYGMFSFKSSGRGRPLPFAQEARLEEYYLNFWKGPCLVTITGSDETPETAKALELIARAVDAKIPMTGLRPFLPGMLPPEWAKETRVVYIKGVLGLNNLYPFFPGDVFRFREGVAAAGAKGQMFILLYDSAEEARRRFSEARLAFEKNPSYKRTKKTGSETLETLDAKGQIIAAAVRGARIEISISAAAKPSR